MVGVTVRREVAGIQRVQTAAAAWDRIVPPDGNRSRLFLSDKKHSFPGFRCEQQRHQFLPGG